MSESFPLRVVRALPSVLLAGTLIVLAGCLGPASVAVINETDETFYVRVDGQWVWEIPARSSGVANTGLEAGHKRVEILHPDCSSANAWGVDLPVTVTIRDRDSLAQERIPISDARAVVVDRLAADWKTPKTD